MVPVLVNCFDRTMGYIQAAIADLTDEEMVRQPVGVPNHAAWTIGHLVLSMQGIAEELGVRQWLPEDWEAVFGYGTSPAEVARSHRASKAALVASLADAADRLRAVLLALDDARMREPLQRSDSREVFQTTGDALLQLVVAHTAFHAGQLAMWRRAIGRKPVGVFV